MEDTKVALDITLGTTPPLFHPHLTIRLAARPDTGAKRCNTLISLLLPDEVFVDPDELSDLYSNLGIAWRVIPEVIDIERPIRLSQPPETGIELRLGIPDDLNELDVPLHVRYLAPSPAGSREVVLLGGQDDARAAHSCGPNDAANLQPVRVPPISMRLPTGNPSHQISVELTTAAVIWLGWLYLAFKMYRLVQRVETPAKLKTS